MSLIQWLTGAKPKPARDKSSRLAFPSSQNSRDVTDSPQAVRKELLRLVLRETLKYNGIPSDWITADALVATSSRREPGIHVRLIMRHWDERLPIHGMAFQQNLETRLLTMDPLAGTWLMGISWQYQLPADADWPRMPHPGVWTSGGAVPEEESMIPQATVVSAGYEDDNPMPVVRTRADLEREMAEEDRRFRVSGTDFEPTQAGGYAATQPAPLR